MAPERSGWLLSEEKVLDSCIRRLCRFGCLPGPEVLSCCCSHQAATGPFQAASNRSLSSSLGPGSAPGGGSAVGSEPRSLCCSSRPWAMAARRPSGTFPSTFCCSLKPSRRRWEKVGAAHTGGAGGTSKRAFSHLRQQAVAWELQEAVWAWQLGPGSPGGLGSSRRWRRWWKTSPAAESWKSDRTGVEGEGRMVAARPEDRNDSDSKAWQGCRPPNSLPQPSTPMVGACRRSCSCH